MIATRTRLIVSRRAARQSSAARNGGGSCPRAGTAHQRGVEALSTAALLRLDAAPGAVGAQRPRKAAVGHDRVEGAGQLALGACILDRDEDLDPVVEVAGHQVGAAE